MRKLVSIVTPCYNEEENVRLLHEAVCNVMDALGKYRYEHIFIDNCSTDRTREVLREMAQESKRVKVIFNSRNFGQNNSPFYALLQARGDAVITMAADFQDPPEMLPRFIEKWEQDYKMVLGIKPTSRENRLMYAVRSVYYKLIHKLSEIELIDNFTGFGLYDQSVVDILRQVDEPAPYLRGLVCEIGFEKALIPFDQPRRARGVSKNNFFSLYDVAMLGITSHSKMPLRLATLTGFILSLVFALFGVIYLIYKLLFWHAFSAGTAPMVIGVFFVGSVLLFFIGVLGEYVGAIYTKVSHRPLVIERERLNFDEEPDEEMEGTA